MNPAPLSIKRKLITGLFFIGVLLAVALAAAGYLYTQLTAYAEPASLGSTSMVDAEEAGRKLRQFEDSFKNNKRGFVRLNESEINSLLTQRYFRERKDASTSAPATTEPQLLNARVRLKNDDITWFAWVRRDYMGHAFKVIWQRSVRLKRVGDQWGFEVLSMRLGRQSIPQPYWEWVQKWVGDSDARLADQYQWLTHLPTIEVKTSDISLLPELLLYNYVAAPMATPQNR